MPYNLLHNQMKIRNVGDEQREAEIKKGVKIRICSASHELGIEIQKQKMALPNLADDSTF